MVLSTLHTNDAPQTIARLMNMGVAPYNITSSVTLVIAQRLARRLHDCKREVHLPEHALLAEGFTRRRDRTPASSSTRRSAARTAPRATRAAPASTRSCR